VWHFSATLDGLPVGETTLLSGATLAGLYDVEVLERFRRRGIGSALVHAALRHGKKLGYRAVALGATGMGASVYAQAGFREVCTLSFWKYGKMRQLTLAKPSLVSGSCACYNAFGRRFSDLRPRPW